MNEEQQIQGSILHIMNLIMIELLRYGFILAHENELNDLKHFVNTDSDSWMTGQGLICVDDEIELLGGLKDEGIAHLMNSVNTLLEFKDTYLMINSLDRDELLLNTEFYEHAQDVYYAYAFDPGTDGTYENTVDNLHGFYMTIEMLLCHCIMQFEHHKLEATKEAEQFYSDYYCTNGYELLTENKNTMLLLDLLRLLTKHANLIDEYYWKLKKETENGKI